MVCIYKQMIKDWIILYRPLGMDDTHVFNNIPYKMKNAYSQIPTEMLILVRLKYPLKCPYQLEEGTCDNLILNI